MEHTGTVTTATTTAWPTSLKLRSSNILPRTPSPDIRTILHFPSGQRFRLGPDCEAKCFLHMPSTTVPPYCSSRIGLRRNELRVLAGTSVHCGRGLSAGRQCGAGPDGAGRLDRAAGRLGQHRPSGNPLTYQWTQTGGTAVTLSSGTAVKPTFTAPASPATLTFQLVVNDGRQQQPRHRHRHSDRRAAGRRCGGGPDGGGRLDCAAGRLGQLRPFREPADATSGPRPAARAGHPVQRHRGPADLHRAGQPGRPDLPAGGQRRAGHSNPATVAITVASTAAGPTWPCPRRRRRPRRTPARARPPARRSTGRWAAIPGTPPRSGPP